MSDTLKQLKAQTSKGAIESKAQAFLTIIKDYQDDKKAIDFVINKLVKLPSHNLFNEVIKAPETQALPLMEIYMRRIVECKNASARRDALSFSAFYKDNIRTVPWRNNDADILKSVIINDPDMYVRAQAFRSYMARLGSSIPAKELYTLCEYCLSKPYDDGGVFVTDVFEVIAMWLPLSSEMDSFITKKLFEKPVDSALGDFFRCRHLHKELKAPPHFSSIKQIINDYIEQIDVELQDRQALIYLATDYLRYMNDYDPNVMQYMQSISEQLASEDLDRCILVQYAYSDIFTFDHAKTEILKIISNEKQSNTIRLFGVEKLQSLYKDKALELEDNDKEQMLAIFDTASDKLKNDVMQLLYPVEKHEPELITLPDAHAAVFFNAMVHSFDDDERHTLWNNFIEAFHESKNNISVFLDTLIEVEAALPYEKSILCYVDCRDKDEAQAWIEKSIKQLNLSSNPQVYKTSDEELDVPEQLACYAAAIKSNGYHLLNIDSGWDSYLAIVVKESDKDSIDAVIEQNRFEETFKYL